jgi:hypothetical protein
MRSLLVRLLVFACLFAGFFSEQYTYKLTLDVVLLICDIQTAMSMDAPKIARQTLNESKQSAGTSSSSSIIKPTTSSSSSRNRTPSSFLTFDTKNHSNNGAKGESGGSIVMNEDQEFIKVVEEVERTRKRMIARANSVSGNSNNNNLNNNQQQGNGKFVRHDPQISKDIMNSIAGLVEDFSIANLNGNNNNNNAQTAAANKRAQEEKELLLRLAQENIHNVRDSYPTSITPAPPSTTAASKSIRDFSPVVEVDNELQSPKRRAEAPVGTPKSSKTPTRQASINSGKFTPKGASHKSEEIFRTPSSDVIQFPLKAEEKESELTSSYRTNRNHHLKVLLLSSLRDWLSLECQVPIPVSGCGPSLAEVERPCGAIPEDQTLHDNNNSNEVFNGSPLMRQNKQFFQGDTDACSSPSAASGGAFITNRRMGGNGESLISSPSSARFGKLENIPQPLSSPQQGSRLSRSSKEKDISKSTASLQALLFDRDRKESSSINNNNNFALGEAALFAAGFGDFGSISKDQQLLFRSSLANEEPNTPSHPQGNHTNKLRFSAKQTETPLFYLSQALRMLESTLLGIGDYQDHHLPAIGGSASTSSSNGHAISGSSGGHGVASGNPSGVSNSHYSTNNINLSNILENAENSQFRTHFRKSLWASALAGSAAGNFVADIISERNLGAL